MSVDYNAYAVLGVMIPKEKLFRISTVPHEEHPIPEGAEFCPKCGKRVSVTEKTPIYEEGSRQNNWTDLLGSFPIVWGTDQEEAYVGEWTRNGRKPIVPSSFETIKAKLREVLEPLGLWDEETFGLYAVLYCSY